MLKNFQCFLLLTPFLFVGCTYGHSNSNPTTPTATSPLDQFFLTMNQISAYQADITVASTLKTQQYRLLYSAPATFQTETITAQGTQTLIYQGNDVFFKSVTTSNWYKLSIPKTDPAKTLGTPNLATWVSPVSSFSNQGTQSCSVGTCTCYFYTDKAGSVSTILIDDANFRLVSISTPKPDGDISILYSYPSVKIDVPQAAIPYPIPSQPSPSDLKLLQEIYGSTTP